MKSEPEIAQTVLGRLTGAPYVITDPRPPSYARLDNPKWYVTCLDGLFFEQTAHAETVWSDSEGTMWIDSSHLGSTTDWVEDAYGEKGAVKAMDINYRDLTVYEVQNRLEDFPKVVERMEAYKRVLGNVSRKSGVQLEMLCQGEESVAWFFFRAKVNIEESTKLEGGLQKTVQALKKAYDAVLEARVS